MALREHGSYRDVSPNKKICNLLGSFALHRALRLKSVETSRSMSELVNEAVSELLAEDAEDLAAFDERAHEPLVSFEELVKDLRARGKI